MSSQTVNSEKTQKEIEKQQKQIQKDMEKQQKQIQKHIQNQEIQIIKQKKQVKKEILYILRTLATHCTLSSDLSIICFETIIGYIYDLITKRFQLKSLEIPRIEYKTHTQHICRQFINVFIKYLQSPNCDNLNLDLLCEIRNWFQERLKTSPDLAAPTLLSLNVIKIEN